MASLPGYERSSLWAPPTPADIDTGTPWWSTQMYPGEVRPADPLVVQMYPGGWDPVRPWKAKQRLFTALFVQTLHTNLKGMAPKERWPLPHWRRCGCAWSLDFFRMICMLPNVFIFLWMKTPACKNEFTSECRLQTSYKCKNTTFFSRQKPRKDSSSASIS